MAGVMDEMSMEGRALVLKERIRKDVHTMWELTWHCIQDAHSTLAMSLRPRSKSSPTENALTFVPSSVATMSAAIADDLDRMP